MTPDPNDAAPPARAEIAGQWCVRIASGGLSADERTAFDAWLTEDPANPAAYDAALSVWGGLRAISDTAEIISRRADALDAMRRANARRWSRRIGRHWQWGIGVATSLVLMLVGGLWLLQRPVAYATEPGERRAVVLADGSRLSLDADTRVSVAYAGGHRELRLLAGRARFDVAKDATRPFTVTAGDQTVIATGTQFSVELLSRQVHVIVYEGSVAVVKGDPPPPARLLAIKWHPGPDAARVLPGRELIAGLDTPVAPRVIAADVSRSLAWEGGQLDLVDEPITEAAERLNRYGAQKIVIGNEAAARIRVSGVFNAGDSAAFVEAVTTAYPLRAARSDGAIVLTATDAKKAQ